MAPLWLSVLMLTDIDKRNPQSSNQVIFGEVIVIPNLERQIPCFCGNTCCYFQSLVPLRIQRFFDVFGFYLIP